MERKYQIFISSTYTDLVEERRQIVEQILNSYHFPIGMEMFEASDKKQWDIIKHTIDTSDIYILVVGNRYGTVDKSTGISYTEMEYDYATSPLVNKPTLVFYSNDIDFKEQVERLRVDAKLKPDKNITETLNKIYSVHYDKNQKQIERFRNKVLDKMSRGFSRNYEIDLDKRTIIKRDIKIDISASIYKKIQELPAGGWIRQVEGYGATSIQGRLKDENTDLFSYGEVHNIEFARVLPTGQSLESEANFARVLETTESSFSIFTNAFKQFYAQEDAVKDCLRRGVHFRILLVDPATEIEGGNNSQWIYHPDTDFGLRNKEKLIADLNSTLDRIKIAKTRAIASGWPGDIEVRYHRRPMYYQVWIQDGNRKNSIAQINVAHFSGFKPHFRITEATSKRLFSLVVDEFDTLWNDLDNRVVVDSKNGGNVREAQNTSDQSTRIGKTADEIDAQMSYIQQRAQILRLPATLDLAKNEVGQMHQILNEHARQLREKRIVTDTDINPHTPNYFIMGTRFHSISFYWNHTNEDVLGEAFLEVCRHKNYKVTSDELIHALPTRGMKDIRRYFLDVTPDFKLSWKLETTDLFFTIEAIIEDALQWLLDATKAALSTRE